MVIFLNSLYKMFDARIDKYDVYKVQAINDSFMIASGIPTQVGQQLGDRHGSEIATLALDLLGASAMFSIPHRPKVSANNVTYTVVSSKVSHLKINGTFLYSSFPHRSDCYCGLESTQAQ